MAQFDFAGSQALQGGVVRYTFGGADANAVVAAVGEYFARRGYSLEEGTPVNGTYGKGNAAGRALLGGFATRFKFKVAVYSGEGAGVLDFSKGMSGAVGGAMGAAKMTKEFTTIQEELKAL
jgi:hypothetical protein